MDQTTSLKLLEICASMTECVMRGNPTVEEIAFLRGRWNTPERIPPALTVFEAILAQIEGSYTHLRGRDDKGDPQPPAKIPTALPDDDPSIL